MNDGRSVADRTSILLIEDNAGDVRLIEEMLREGIRRSAGPSGSATASEHDLRRAERLSDGLRHLDDGDVDVVLLDLGLPDSTGLDTLETVLGRSPNVPVVVLTGLNDEAVGDRAVQRGAQEYLVKDELTPTLLRRSLRHAIERKRFERTQTALHTASREFIQAQSKVEVSQLAVDTAVDVLDLRGIAITLFDDSENVLRPAAYTDYIEEILGEIPSFGSADTSITWQAFITDETIALDDALESEHIHRRDLPFRSGIWIPLGDHGVMIIVSEVPGGFDRHIHQLTDHLAATMEATFDRIEHEESLREHERELKRRNRQLEELDQINGIIREIDQVLVQTATRDAIERSICELLVRDGRFAFAWIGEPVDGARLRPRTWAGDDRGYLDAVSLRTDTDEGPPAVTAISMDAVTVVPNVATDLRGSPWRKAALARGLQSVLSIPLAYNELSYGVLTVFANEPDAFDPRSTEIFEELGETIANAMNSAETRQALLTDTVVELELAIREPNDALVRLTRATDCRIEYGGLIPQSDGTVRIFFSATDAPASAIQSAAEDVPRIRQFDCISGVDGGDETSESRFEMTISGSVIPSTLVECGAVVRSLRVGESEIRAVVELPNTTDVRTFINRVDERYSETELLARRDRERSEESERAGQGGITSDLTDRQLEVLQTAYHSGYFEWPRDRTGEEVAESLGITQPTFNDHLRAAERKIYARLFDGTSSLSH